MLPESRPSEPDTIRAGAAMAPAPRRELAVTQISTTDLWGGAARAAHRLHRTLGAAGVMSHLLVARRYGNDPGVVEYNPLAPAPAFLGRGYFRLVRRWHRPPFEKAGAYFSLDRTLTGGRLLSQIPPSDVVNLHWVADLLDYRSLPALAARTPIVWTFHDMNAFTGGCHYSGWCQRFTGRCGSCPQLVTSTGDGDMTRRVLERKEAILTRVPRSRLVVVSPSEWLARETRRSHLFGEFDARVIPNGLDLHEFRPMERAEARRRLNLPPDAPIVLFVADLIEDRRKGLRLLLKAFQRIRPIPGLLLVTIGRGGCGPIPPHASRHLGSLSDSEDLRAAYSAADAFTIPSLQDNLPNTILESMACGTPVVGFSAGGVGEAVVDGETGLLAPTGDFEALAAALQRVLEDRPLQRRLGQNARARVQREYAIELQARRYAALYAELRERAESGLGEEAPR